MPLEDGSLLKSNETGVEKRKKNPFHVVPCRKERAVTASTRTWRVEMGTRAGRDRREYLLLLLEFLPSVSGNIPPEREPRL